MPWGWILTAFLVPAGLLLLAAALFHVRVRAGWSGAWESLDSRQDGYFRVEYGFPGFMRTWDWEEEEEEEEDGGRETGDGGERQAQQPRQEPTRDPVPSAFSPADSPARNEDSASDAARSSSRETSSPSHSSSPPSPVPSPPSRKRRFGRRARRALFRLVTDGKAWRLVLRHGYKSARGAWRLLRPRIAIAVGHPDPVKLGRFAGYWHASAPLIAASRATLELRFQDRRPTFAIRAEGGFSALSLLLFGIGRTSAFPWIGLGRRVWFSWWRHELEGWREWAYRGLQG